MESARYPAARVTPRITLSDDAPAFNRCLINDRFKVAAAHIKRVDRVCSGAGRGNPRSEKALVVEALDAYEFTDRVSMERCNAMFRRL